MVQHTPGPWHINHWSKGNSGVYCNGSNNGIKYFTGDAVMGNRYGIRAKIDPMNHGLEASFEGAHIADINDFRSIDDGTECRANAILIAASPELATTVKLLLDGMRSLARQIPNNEGLADWDLGLAEIAEAKAIDILSRIGYETTTNYTPPTR